jgi:hypothetical protein
LPFGVFPRFGTVYQETSGSPRPNGKKWLFLLFNNFGQTNSLKNEPNFRSSCEWSSGLFVDVRLNPASLVASKKSRRRRYQVVSFALEVFRKVFLFVSQQKFEM